MSIPRQGRNPIFNSNRFKLGTFATNTIGAAQTLAPDAYVPTWENSLRLAKTADRAGFEAILGLARWKNPDVPIDGRSNVVMDSFTWCAGLAMATQYSALFATSHAPTVHPLVVAKQCATIDHISGGRFGLNVVGGWNRQEFDMFGLQLLEHDQRYDYLEEWVTVLYKLWEGAEEFDFDGRFLKLKGAMSRPQTVQKPHIPILNAGMSPRGQRFACEYADCCFVTSRIEKSEIQSYKKMAREQFGREVGIWMSIPMTQRKTRQEAEEAVDYYAVQHEDTLAVDGIYAGAVSDTRTLKNEATRFSRRLFALGGDPVLGSATDIADQLETLSDKGVDGILISWADFDDGMMRFTEEVLPLLEKRGLRERFEPDGN